MFLEGTLQQTIRNLLVATIPKMNKPTYQEIIEYLTSIIEHGSNKDLLELYNAYTKQALTIEQVETKQINND